MCLEDRRERSLSSQTVPEVTFSDSHFKSFYSLLQFCLSGSYCFNISQQGLPLQINFFCIYLLRKAWLLVAQSSTSVATRERNTGKRVTAGEVTAQLQKSFLRQKAFSLAGQCFWGHCEAMPPGCHSVFRGSRINPRMQWNHIWEIVKQRFSQKYYETF